MKKTNYLMRLLVLLLAIYSLSSCDPERNFNSGESTQIATTKVHHGVSVSTVYCLRDLLSGNPSTGGCWEIVSVPDGSTITQAMLDAGGDNPCLNFEGQPCPADYVFRYSVLCDCPLCKKSATLTICLVCECGDPIVTSITCSI